MSHATAPHPCPNCVAYLVIHCLNAACTWFRCRACKTVVDDVSGRSFRGDGPVDA